MKLKNIIYTVGLAWICSSCASDYLDTTPQSSVGKVTIFETTDNAKLAVNGLCRMMYIQYLGQQGFNGEATIKFYYGNYPGNDFQQCKRTSFKNTATSGYIEDNTRYWDYYPWFYYYKLIGNSNAIIMNIDAAQGKEADKQFIKAQALTVRAYAYTMLTQLYCFRWQDSNNGSTRGLPLRLDENTGDLAPSTLGQVYAQIYQDLDDAVSNYASSGQDRDKSDNYSPSLDVAYCTYARAALIREDWATAAKYAALARKNYPLMNVSEYMDGGFNTVNKEWIWSSYGEAPQKLYYYGFFAYIGSNANSSVCRQYPCAISKELYDQIPETDIRRSMFLGVEASDGIKDYSARVQKGALYNRAKADYSSKLYSTTYIFPYMQFKFQCKDNYGVGDPNHFRSSEMYLIEAEANCHLGKEAEARNLLLALVKESGRDPEYACDKSGDELLDEVRLYRRIELWGEGFDWFDLKRWKLPRIRKTSAEGGSFVADFVVNAQPSDLNNWTWVYPYRETAYNGAFISDPVAAEE